MISLAFFEHPLFDRRQCREGGVREGCDMQQRSLHPQLLWLCCMLCNHWAAKALEQQNIINMNYLTILTLQCVLNFHKTLY